MSEKPDLFPFGYGRGWREPKATGIARLFQIGREPATKTTWYVLIGASAASWLIMALATWLAA